MLYFIFAVESGNDVFEHILVNTIRLKFLVIPFGLGKNVTEVLTSEIFRLDNAPMLGIEATLPQQQGQKLPVSKEVEEKLIEAEKAAEEFEKQQKELEEQEKAAKKMNISQPTFNRLILSARKKIADAVVNGKAIRINENHFNKIKFKEKKNENCNRNK